MISWCFDQIERMVNKLKETEMKLTSQSPPPYNSYDTISDNTSAMKVEMQKVEMQMAQTQAKYQLMQQAQAAHPLLYGQYGGSGTTTTTNGIGHLPAYYTTLSPTATPIVWHTANTVTNQATYIPAPCGIIHKAIFVDADGTRHMLSVDANFVYLIDQMNQSHGSLHQYINPIQTKPCLPDPDFSLDDLGVAEELIEEMNGTAGQ